jgi:N-acyl-D-amino-acid deacylase
VIVFDPEKVQDLATYSDPHQHATGMRWVLVNGRVVIDDGVATKTLAGVVLKRQ